MTLEELLEDSIKTLGGVRPTVEDYDSVTVPVMHVRNNLIQLLLHLQKEAGKKEEEEI